LTRKQLLGRQSLSQTVHIIKFTTNITWLFYSTAVDQISPFETV